MTATGIGEQREAHIAVSWRLDPFINGDFVRGEGPELQVDNPATEDTIAIVRTCSAGQLNAAVEAARRAFDSGCWRDPDLRRAVLLRMADLLDERQAEFVSTVVQEVGTPIALCDAIHIGGPIDMLRMFADLAVKDRERRLGEDGRNPASESIVRFEPVGVVAAIGAYNYPLTMMVAKAGAALAAGCACVFLPSPLTPLASLLFGEIAQAAGVPPGILNIVAGGAEIGAAMTTHPLVDKVTFTGSVEVGRKVMEQAATGLKGVVLELGGKSPGIILPEADFDRAVLPLHRRYLRNAGQGCQSPTRLMVPRARMDDFIEASRAAYANIKVGDPWDPETVAGPLISRNHRDRVHGDVSRALAAGGQVLAGGGPSDQPRGWFYNPTLIGGVDNHSEIARNELFGPVAIVLPYDTVDEMVELANDTDFGLAASVYGDLEHAKAVATRLRAGTVYINGAAAPRFDAVLTGWKHSGIGREWGNDGVEEFLEAQHIQWLV